MFHFRMMPNCGWNTLFMVVYFNSVIDLIQQSALQLGRLCHRMCVFRYTFLVFVSVN